MWFWTECSHLIGSERLYIPHSRMGVFKSLYVVGLAVNNSITFKEIGSKRYINYCTLFNFGGLRVWACLHKAKTTFFFFLSS